MKKHQVILSRILSLLAALALTLSCAGGGAEAAPREAGAPPRAGDAMNGFEVKEIREFPQIGAELVLFEHRKTGGRMLWIANGDTNRTFQYTILTRADDDTGLPHVFEHATLSGSEKYPSTSVHLNLIYQTYNTYINAITTDLCTNYPVASLSEAQLLKLAEYYGDACFNPMIMTDRRIFDAEAWHYSLDDPEGELTYQGIVYSEMQGSFNSALAARGNAYRVTFPGSSLGYDYAGNPDHIPEMTWEDVKAYHDKYYHPSNCLAILYGKIEDYTAFLALLDSYFSRYERAEFSRAEPDYTRITKSAVASFPYPVAAGTDITNQSVIYYCILCPGMADNTEEEKRIDNLCSMLNQSGSVLSQSFRKAFPAGSLYCCRVSGAPDDAVAFIASGVNENDGGQLKAIVDEALSTVAENGFSREMTDSALTALKIAAKTASEDGRPAEGVVYNFSYEYAASGNPFMYAEKASALNALEEENRQGLLKDACARWLTGDVLYTLTTTYPAPGEKEKRDAALAEKLAGIKAGMTQEELQAIVDATHAEPEKEDVSGMIAQLKAVTVESLPEEIRTYDVRDNTDDSGLRHIEVTAGVDGICYTGLLMDTAALPQEYLHYMQLYTQLLGRMDTGRHPAEELDTLISRYLYGKATGILCIDCGDSVRACLTGEWFALDEDLAAGYDLMEELLFDSRFDDTRRLAEQISAQKTYVRSAVDLNASEIMKIRGLAERYPYYRYTNYLYYLDYYAFLEKLEAEIAETPQAVTEALQFVQSFLANSAGAVSIAAGNAQSIALNRPLADAFMARRDHILREPAVYDLPVPARREALIIDSGIQDNNLTASAEDMGLEGYRAELAVTAALVSDRLLIPLLREQMGVYTPDSILLENGAVYTSACQDPNIKETFDVYATLGDRIAALEVNQETLDGYIMSVYSDLAKPLGELTGAIAAIQDALAGKDPARKLEYMRRIKGVTPETVRADAEYYRRASENGVLSTNGSAAAIYANAELYDVILNPFNVLDTSRVELADAAPGSEYYDTVRFVFENGLMAPRTDDAFGVDEPGTAGDLYAALYVLVGGAPDMPEEAMALMEQYGLVPEGMETDTVLTVGMCDQILVNFGMAVGLNFQADSPEETAGLPITRFRMAQQIERLVSMAQ